MSEHPTEDADELRRQVEELHASSRRLVKAADTERRRIERELHDETQQDLVALAVNLQLARQLSESDPAAAKALLEEIGRDVRDALDGVRRLAQTIYPPLLADRGLGDALRAAASALGIRARVDASGPNRFPPEVESAVYDCCVEALANAAKHGGPGTYATVELYANDGVLEFAVDDDGVGFDERTVVRGSGLTQASDRLAALGGVLTVVSRPGSGTHIHGALQVT